MKFTEDLSNQKINTIAAYEQDHLVVRDRKISESVIIAPDYLEPWDIGQLTDISPEHLQMFRELNPEVILIGTGNRHVFPPREVLELFVKTGIGYEFMDTRAACRTYNILVSEDREVVSGLIIES